MNTLLWPKPLSTAWATKTLTFSIGLGLMGLVSPLMAQTPYWVDDDDWNVPVRPVEPVEASSEGPWVEVGPDRAGPSRKAFDRRPDFQAETAQTKPRHATSVMYSHSSLSQGRGQWDELDTTYYYMIHPQVMGTARVVVRDRNGVRDTIQELGVEYYPPGRWQFRAHGARTVHPDFTYKSAVGAGVSYYLNERVDLHLDAKQYRFEQGNITEIRPGVGVHLSPQTQMVGTYIQGDAYGRGNYQGGVLKVIHQTQRNHRWTVSASSTIDPERTDVGVDFSRSKQLGVTYQFPVRTNVDVVVGAEHEWREEYNRTGVMMGVVARW